MSESNKQPKIGEIWCLRAIDPMATGLDWTEYQVEIRRLDFDSDYPDDPIIWIHPFSCRLCPDWEISHRGETFSTYYRFYK